MILTDKEKQKLADLLTEYHNTSFDCGEWGKHDSDESYSKVHKRYVKADERLVAYLGELFGYEKGCFKL